MVNHDSKLSERMTSLVQREFGNDWAEAHEHDVELARLREQDGPFRDSHHIARALENAVREEIERARQLPIGSHLAASLARNALGAVDWKELGELYSEQLLVTPELDADEDDEPVTTPGPSPGM